MSALQDMLEMQFELQKVMPPFPNRSTSDDPQTICEYIKDNIYACEDELHELGNECGWKPWTTSWHVNYQAARGEWIDAWHFLLNLANRLGMTEQMIVNMYNEKHAINAKRQADGYDGVSSKCPVCRRALDDPSVTCVTQDGYSFCSSTQTESSENGAMM